MKPPDLVSPHLPDVTPFIEPSTLDDNLQELSVSTAAMLGAEYCSIMLLEENGDNGPQLHVCASAGSLPAAAYKEVVGKNQGVAGHVMANGIGLRIDDIRQSAFAGCARRSEDERRSLMCAPIRLHRRMVGVVNISGRHASGPFDAHELKLLEAMALYIGKAIQVSQLQSMLNSRFAQMAVIQEAARGITQSLAEALPNPDQVAKIMAKSFYKEMTRAGFGSRQIINAASEIIAQLSGNLNRHSKRLGTDGLTGAPPLREP